MKNLFTSPDFVREHHFTWILVVRNIDFFLHVYCLIILCTQCSSHFTWWHDCRVPLSKLILLKEINTRSEYQSFLSFSVIVSCFQLLRPVCSAGETFCFMTDACSTDATCSHKATCTSPKSYCPYVQNCYPTCSLWAVTKKRNGTETAPTVSLKVVKSLDISITATGHKVQRLASPFEVLPGKLLIFHKESFISYQHYSFFIWSNSQDICLTENEHLYSMNGVSSFRKFFRWQIGVFLDQRINCGSTQHH